MYFANGNIERMSNVQTEKNMMSFNRDLGVLGLKFI